MYVIFKTQSSSAFPDFIKDLDSLFVCIEVDGESTPMVFDDSSEAWNYQSKEQIYGIIIEVPMY